MFDQNDLEKISFEETAKGIRAYDDNGVLKTCFEVVKMKAVNVTDFAQICEIKIIYANLYDEAKDKSKIKYPNYQKFELLDQEVYDLHSKAKKLSISFSMVRRGTSGKCFILLDTIYNRI